MVAAGAVVLYLAQVYVLREFVTDDAFISLRYARNFAEGYGAVWNPGGTPVEGFSNPLFVLLEAGAFAAGLDGVAAARVMGLAAGLALLGVCWFWGRRIVGEWGAAAAAVFIAATPGLAYWSVGGLETLPMALVLTAAALVLARSDGGSAPLAAALLALLPWIRPEGLAIAGALVFFSEVRGLLDAERRGATLRRLAWLALLPLASQVVLQALRWGLYEHIAPNSVLYKTGRGVLGTVTVRFVAEYAIYVVLGLYATFRVRGRAKLLVVPAAVYLVASFTFLNSVNQFSRLLLPTLPLWALLAGAALPAPSRWRGWRQVAAVAPVPVIALLMVLVMPASLPTAYETARRYMGCRHIARVEAGQWLQSRLRPGDVYVIADAGVVPFYATGTAHDLRPRFFVLSSEEPDRLRPHYGVDRRARRDPRFDAFEQRVVTGPRTFWMRELGGSTTQPCDYFLHIFERGAEAEASG